MADCRAVLGGLGAAAVAIVAGAKAVDRVRLVLRRARPTKSAAMADRVFDPAAFCADLHAAGLELWLNLPVGPGAGRPSCFIVPGCDGRPTPAERDVLARWSTAMVACPDHADRVVTHLLERERATT